MEVSSVAFFFNTYLLTIHLVGSKNSPYLLGKPSTYIVVIYFPTYLYLYMRPISYRSGDRGETRIWPVKLLAKPQEFHLHTTSFEPWIFCFFAVPKWTVPGSHHPLSHFYPFKLFNIKEIRLSLSMVKNIPIMMKSLPILDSTQQV
jgi:hypothetical protein